MKYFVSYKYSRIREEVIKKKTKIIQWDSYSSDPVELLFEINTHEDIQRLEKHMFDLLKRSIPLNQEMTALLVLGIYPIK